MLKKCSWLIIHPSTNFQGAQHRDKHVNISEFFSLTKYLAVRMTMLELSGANKSRRPTCEYSFNTNHKYLMLQ
jgi:hypothetical protein